MLIPIILFLIVLSISSGDILQQPSNINILFNPEDSKYFKYSAILAAVEPFRTKRDNEVRKSIGPLSLWLMKLKGIDVNNPTLLAKKVPQVSQLCKNYTIITSRIAKYVSMILTYNLSY
jgi:hypothetical protein